MKRAVKRLGDVPIVTGASAFSSEAMQFTAKSGLVANINLKFQYFPGWFPLVRQSANVIEGVL